jgi:hypothetical protein
MRAAGVGGPGLVCGWRGTAVRWCGWFRWVAAGVVGGGARCRCPSTPIRSGRLGADRHSAVGEVELLDIERKDLRCARDSLIQQRYLSPGATAWMRTRCPSPMQPTGSGRWARSAIRRRDRHSNPSSIPAWLPRHRPAARRSQPARCPPHWRCSTRSPRTRPFMPGRVRVGPYGAVHGLADNAPLLLRLLQDVGPDPADVVGHLLVSDRLRPPGAAFGERQPLRGRIASVFIRTPKPSTSTWSQRPYAVIPCNQGRSRRQLRRVSVAACSLSLSIKAAACTGASRRSGQRSAFARSAWSKPNVSSGTAKANGSPPRTALVAAHVAVAGSLPPSQSVLSAASVGCWVVGP